MMTFQEIADQLGEGRRSVENTYYKALTKFEMGLIKRGITLQDLLAEDYHQRKVWNIGEPE